MPIEIENKPQNYTTDPKTSMPDSRLSTFVKGCRELTQIYSVKPLCYADIIGEYWQRINDLIYTLGLTETQEIVTNIGWTVPVLGKQRSDLVPEELGTLITETNGSVTEISNDANTERDINGVAGYGTGKQKAHKYGLIQSIDMLFGRNIDTWGDLYSYFYDNKNNGTHPINLGKMLFGESFQIDDDKKYYYLDEDGNKIYINDLFVGDNNVITTGGIGSEVVKLVNTVGKDFYDWLNSDKLCVSYGNKVNNNKPELDENGNTVPRFKEGPNSLKELLFDDIDDSKFCELMRGLPSQGVINEINNIVNYLGDNYYSYVYNNLYVNEDGHPTPQNPNYDPENPTKPIDPRTNPLWVLQQIDIGEVLYGNKNEYNETIYENDYIDKAGYICETSNEKDYVMNYASNQENIFHNFNRLSYGTTQNGITDTINTLFTKKSEITSNSYSIKSVPYIHISNPYGANGYSTPTIENKTYYVYSSHSPNFYMLSNKAAFSKSIDNVYNNTLWSYETYGDIGDIRYIVLSAKINSNINSNINLVVEYNYKNCKLYNGNTENAVEITDLADLPNYNTNIYFYTFDTNGNKINAAITKWYYYWDFINYVKSFPDSIWMNFNNFSFATHNLDKIPTAITVNKIPVVNISKFSIPETRAWNYNNGVITSGFNTNSMIALTSDKKYDSYQFSCVPYSDNDDDDIIGIVLSSYTDSNTGITHSLMLTRSHYKLSLRYDTEELVTIGTILGGTDKIHLKGFNGATDYDTSAKLQTSENTYDIYFKHDTTKDNTTEKYIDAADEATRRFKTYDNLDDDFYYTYGPHSLGVTTSVNSGIEDSETGQALGIINYTNVLETIKFYIEQVREHNKKVIWKNFFSNKIYDITSKYNALYNYKENLTIDNIKTIIKPGQIILCDDINFNNGAIGVSGTNYTPTPNIGTKNTFYMNGWGMLNAVNNSDENKKANPQFNVIRKKINPNDNYYTITINYKDIYTNIGDTHDITLYIENKKLKCKFNTGTKETIVTISNNISSILRMFSEKISYGYMVHSQPLASFKNINFIDLDGGDKIYDLEKEQIYSLKENDNNYTYELEPIYKSIFQEIVDEYHYGRFITNSVTGKTFFVSKEYDKLIKITDPVLVNTSKGLSINKTTANLNQIDLDFIEEYNPSDSTINFNKKIITNDASIANITATNITSANANITSNLTGKNATLSGTLHLSNTQDISGTSTASPALIIGDKTGQRIEFDGNEIISKTGTGTAVQPNTLYLNEDGGLVQIGSGGLNVKGDITNTGSINPSGTTKLGTTIIGTTGTNGAKNLTVNGNETVTGTSTLNVAEITTLNVSGAITGTLSKSITINKSGTSLGTYNNTANVTINIPNATTDSTGVVSVGSNISVSAGKISVATASKSSLGVVKVGNGLIVGKGENAGLLSVDIAAIASAISDSEDNSINSKLMLASLGLPISTGNVKKTWYVDGNKNNDEYIGTDTPTYKQLFDSYGKLTQDEKDMILNGKSETKRASESYKAAYEWGTNENYPFRTISGALQFIRTHYSLGTVDCDIVITPLKGTVGPDERATGENAYSGFTAGQYQSSGGVLNLKSSSSSKLVAVWKAGISGYTCAFNISDYNIYDFHFIHKWYGATYDISSNKITNIVENSSNNNVEYHNCTFTLEDYTNKTADGANVTSTSHVSQTRLIHSINGNSTYFFGGTFNINHTDGMLSADGYPRGALFYAEISSYIGLRKLSGPYTFTGEISTMFTATRQSMIGGLGSTPSDDSFKFITSNFKAKTIMNFQNASGFERNGLPGSIVLHTIKVPIGNGKQLRASDNFSSGAWIDDYKEFVYMGRVDTKSDLPTASKNIKGQSYAIGKGDNITYNQYVCAETTTGDYKWIEISSIS